MDLTTLDRTSDGSFISMDPKGLNGGDYNLYRYALDRPTRFVDPMGTDVEVFETPIEGFIGKLGFMHTYVVIGQPTDYFLLRIDFGPKGGHAVYSKFGQVDFSAVTQSELEGHLITDISSTQAQDIDVIIRAMNISQNTSQGSYPYFIDSSIYGNNCTSFSNDLLNTPTLNSSNSSPLVP